MGTAYFGTDGIRGKANEKLMPEVAYKVGRYLGYKLVKNEGDKFLIGRDTRLSGTMLESALAAGLMASGCNVHLLGVVVTPLVAHVLKESDYVGGIMISASHNPFYDNGLKVMNNDGLKIDEFLQAEIEQYLNGEIEIPYRTDELIGQVFYKPELISLYTDYLKEVFNDDYSNFKICIDAANGSTSFLSDIFRSMNMRAEVINNRPNGININDKCGSTHPVHLKDYMKNKDFDLGVAYDGDGDRLIMVDCNNNIIDGDAIMYILANYYQSKNELKDDTVVVTVMSNLGLHKAFEKVGIKTIVTDVGDKNVFEKMVNDNYIIGGEQSGHIIVKNHSNMGDGLLVTLKILKIMHDTNASLDELVKDLRILPQLLENIKVKEIKPVLESTELSQIISEVESNMDGNGRVLVRASGTEPLIRVMVEADSDDLCRKYVSDIIEVIKEVGV